MGSEWRDCTIGDAVTLQRGFDITKKDQMPGNIPVVSSGGVRSFHAESKVKSPGVVLGRKGTLGTVFFLNEDFWPHDTTLWVKDFKGNNARFIYYFFQNISDFLQSLDAGTSNPALNRNHVHPVEMCLPPLPEQEAIAHILGSLDDKIELNRRMNATLEGLAQALFQSWFVDFDPVLDNALAAGNPIPDELTDRAAVRRQALDNGTANREAAQHFPANFQFTAELGWIPEGWEISTIDQECDFLNGYAFKSKELSSTPEESFHVFKMGNIKRGGGFNFEGTKSYYPKTNANALNKYLLKKGDLLIAMTDMKSSMALLGHTALMSLNDVFLVNQRVGRIRGKAKSVLNYPYLYFYSNLPAIIGDLRSRSNSGVQVNLSTAEIKKTLVLVPSKICHDLFDSVSISLLDKFFSNDDEKRILSNLRDTLLPQLISGELRIPDAAKLAEAALA